MIPDYAALHPGYADLLRIQASTRTISDTPISNGGRGDEEDLKIEWNDHDKNKTAAGITGRRSIRRVRYQTMFKCSMPLITSFSFASLLFSLIMSRSSFTESAFLSASS